MAYAFLHKGMLSYSTAYKGPISYLQDVSNKISGQKLNYISRRNLITRYAREASVECLSSLREGVVGLLLDEIRAGNDLRNFWKYADDNIERADKIFVAFGYKPHDLATVYLTQDPVPQNAILWSPK